MEINTDFGYSNVNGATPPQRPVAPVPVGDNGDQVSLANSAALQSALASAPNSRPEVVTRARAWISNPNYPGADLTSQMSQFLAEKLMDNNSE